MAKGNISSQIPAEAIESLARVLLPKIQEFFETEEGKKEFEEWKAEQEQENNQLRKRRNRYGERCLEKHRSPLLLSL